MLRTLTGVLCVGLLIAPPGLAQSAKPPEAVAAVNPAPSPAAPGFRPEAECPLPEAAPADRFEAEVDSLLSWFKPVCLAVPVVAVGNRSDRVPGAVGQPGTQVAVGGVPPHRFDFGATPGGAVELGWLRGDGAFGVQVRGFLMDTAAAGQAFVASPSGSPASYLPYTAPDNARQALPFTIPGVVTGNSMAIGSTHLWGAEGNLTFPFTGNWLGGPLAGTFLLGGRYLDLTDRDRVVNSLSLVADPGAFAVGADQVITRNQFYGPQVGVALGGGLGRLSLEGTLKLAAGLTHQARNIEGAPVLVSTVASPLLVPGPLIALPSNVGRETADRVTLVPEVGIRSRLALTPCWSVTLGYRLIYWNKVLCPGDQMDPLVNVTQLPFHGPFTGPAQPAPLFVHTDYFAQGLELGLQFRF